MHWPLPAVNVPEQVSPLLALTVTLPVGLPGATLKFTVTNRPTLDGLGVLPVMLVVVLAGLTTNVTVVPVTVV